MTFWVGLGEGMSSANQVSVGVIDLNIKHHEPHKVKSLIKIIDLSETVS